MFLSVSAKVRMSSAGTIAMKPFGDAAGSILEGDDAAQEQVRKGDEQGDDAAPGQTDGSAGVRESINKTCAVPEAVSIHQADDAEYNKYDNGNEHIPDACVFDGVLFIVAEGTEFALKRLQFGHGHGAVIETHDGDGDDEHDGQQGIEVIRNSLNEKLDTGNAGVKILRGGRNGSCPGGHGGDHAYRRGSCVNNICELCAGDVVAVGNGTHDGADGQAVEIVVNEDEHTEEEGCDYRTGAGVNMLRSPAAERGGAAYGVDERDHDAQQNEEHEDTCVAAVRKGGNKAVIDHSVERADKIEAADKKRADNNADKQRRISLLGDKGPERWPQWEARVPRKYRTSVLSS